MADFKKSSVYTYSSSSSGTARNYYEESSPLMYTAATIYGTLIKQIGVGGAATYEYNEIIPISYTLTPDRANVTYTGIQTLTVTDTMVMDPNLMILGAVTVGVGANPNAGTASFDLATGILDLSTISAVQSASQAHDITVSFDIVVSNTATITNELTYTFAVGAAPGTEVLLAPSVDGTPTFVAQSCVIDTQLQDDQDRTGGTAVIAPGTTVTFTLTINSTISGTAVTAGIANGMVVFDASPEFTNVAIASQTKDGDPTTDFTVATGTTQVSAAADLTLTVGGGTPTQYVLTFTGQYGTI